MEVWKMNILHTSFEDKNPDTTFSPRARLLILKDIYFFNAKMSPGHLNRGIGYTRSMEYPLVMKRLCLKDNISILDIGSGTGLFPLYLASKGYRVCPTDIKETVLLSQLEYAKRLGLKNLIDSGKFIVEKQDARSLSYPNNSFDRITSISVLEHIPGNGDVQAMKEIGRVLRKGGRAVVTVPYARARSKRKEKNKFSQRWYDERAIQHRLVKPSGLMLQEKEYFGDRIFPFFKHWSRIPLTIKRPILWLQTLFSMIFLQKIDEEDLDKAYLACLTFSKE